MASLETKTMKYQGTYQDKFGTEEVTVFNDFKEISFKLQNFNFVSAHFNDFELYDYNKYNSEQLNRFTFEPISIYNSNDKVYELKDFILSFTVPVTILNLSTNLTTSSSLFIRINTYRVNPFTDIFLEIVYEGKKFSASSELFEIAADHINKQIDGEFVIKNCFWCLYSDYSVSGQGLAGSMLCFLKYKKEYLNVKNKSEYMDLPNDIPVVQEIFYCNSYEPRKSGTGYRG